MSEDLKESLVLIFIVVLVAFLSLAAGFGMGSNSAHRDAARLGLGEFRVDPVNGGDAKWHWHTNALDLSK